MSLASTIATPIVPSHAHQRRARDASPRAPSLARVQTPRTPRRAKGTACFASERDAHRLLDDAMSVFLRRGRLVPIAFDLAPVVAVAVRAFASSDAVVASANAVLLFWLAQVFVLRASPYRDLARVRKNALRGQCVWVTGATQGLGEAVAYACAGLGARVVVSGRTSEKCKRVAEECERRGADGAHTVTFDVCAPRSELKRAVDEVYETVGSVDVFVNAAGGSQACSALAGDSEDVDRMLFQLNAIGAISLTKEVAKRMVNSGASRSGFAPKIVGVCSAASKVPAPGQSVYAAAKSAYAAFLNSLRSEIAKTGVRVTCVYPGPIATGLNGQERVIFRQDMASSTPSPGAAKKTQSRTAAPPSTKGRMDVDYVAKTVVRSTIAEFDEIVLAPQPIMALSYFARFFPALAYAALDIIGPTRARKADAGENIYDLKAKR